MAGQLILPGHSPGLVERRLMDLLYSDRFRDPIRDLITYHGNLSQETGDPEPNARTLAEQFWVEEVEEYLLPDPDAPGRMAAILTAILGGLDREMIIDSLAETIQEERGF